MNIRKIISLLYSVLVFCVPLVFYYKTSELFEFNKIVVLYGITILIALLWSVEMIIEKRFVFVRTLLDIPLLLFLGSQIISTIISIDTRTSVLGYYSRFNGGLVSLICYAILYWGFVTHITKKDLPRVLANIFFSSTIAGMWGTLEHVGHSPSCLLITGNFDVSCWVQEVQLRVFATFGQPNWMAAWMAIVIPLSLYYLFQQKVSTKKYLISLSLFGLFFANLLFTKSKSGLAGFALSAVVFLVIVLYGKIKRGITIPVKQNVLALAIISSIIAVVGTPWTPSISEYTSHKNEASVVQEIKGGTSLETGGTDSGIIRRIVWQGALNVWRDFPLFGSGVETFAFSYYRGRPMSHNNVSEWNFLYNKAHNEYLNYLATTGIVGLSTYLLLIGASLVMMVRGLRNAKSRYDFYFYSLAISGYISLLVTNFFGFSVVATSILFFIIPAFITVAEDKKTLPVSTPDGIQIAGISLVLIAGLFISASLINYWKADYLYARAEEARNEGDFAKSVENYKRAISLSPSESLYHANLANLYANAISQSETDHELNDALINNAVEELNKSTTLSPQNVRILKSVANSYASLGDVDTKYLYKTLEVTQELEVLAPTDPSVLYQQSLTFAKLGRFDDAITLGEKAVEMKPDYKIARRLLAFLYEHTKQNDRAIPHLQYILKYISPEDTDVQKELSSLKSK